MKKFFMSLLKAAGYFAIYFGWQLIVNVIGGFVIGVMVTARFMTQGKDMTDPAVTLQYMEESTNILFEQALLMTVIAGVFTLLTLWIIFLCRKKKFTGEVGMCKLNPAVIPGLVLMGLGFNVLTGVVLSLFPEEMLNAYEESASLITGGNVVVMFIGTVIMAPLVEEIVLRGLIYTRLKKGMPMLAAMIISSVVFGLLHGQILWVAYATLFGMLLVWVFERTKSLFGSILLHLSFNLCSFLQTFIPEDAPDAVGVALVAVSVVFAAVGLFLFLKVPKAEEPVEELAVEVIEVVEPVVQSFEE